MPLDVYSKIFRRDKDDKGIQFLEKGINVCKVYVYYSSTLIQMLL